jgi:hypothetical protein
MIEYRVRFLDQDMAVEVDSRKLFPDNARAIVEAIKLAGGRGVEVWREMECIYRSVPNPMNNEPWAA